MKQSTFNFWLNWFILGNFIAIGVGLLCAFAGNSIFLELHNEGTQTVFFEGKELSPPVLQLKNWLFGIIGRTIVGFHILLIFIAKNAMSKGENWAFQAAWLSLLLWFLIDSGLSIFYGAWHNVWLINLPAFVMLCIPLIMLTFFREK